MASILAVDDSPSVIKMVEFALKTRGHEVTTAADGQAALESLERRRFDLLVLDINMPRLDGLSLLKLVRARAEWNDTLVLMLTTEGQDSDRDEALALGATGYMMKPFKPNELLARVSALVSGAP
jgi:two-component system chemotaxis response regulator CheY